MVMNGKEGLLMFFEPFCKGSCRFSYIFFLTPIFTTFESVYDPTFVGDRIFVLGGHEQVFYGLTISPSKAGSSNKQKELTWGHQSV